MTARERGRGPDGHGRTDAGHRGPHRAPGPGGGGAVDADRGPSQTVERRGDGASTSQIDSDRLGDLGPGATLTTPRPTWPTPTSPRPSPAPWPRSGLTVGEQVTGPPRGASGNAGTGSTGLGPPGGQQYRLGCILDHLVGSAQIVVISTDSYVVSTTVDDTEVGQVKSATRRSSRRAGRPPRSTARSRRSG